MPQELQVGSQWVLERGGAANNNIIIDSFDRSSGAFTAHYAVIDNPSTFTGTLYARERSLLSMAQRDGRTGYTALHVGSAALNEPGWIGSWGDVTQDHVAAFKMLPP